MYIKKILVENQERIPNLQVFKREVTFEDNANYILTGQRRAGKTFLLYHKIQQLIKEGIKPDQILYINFEDERLLEFKAGNFEDLLESYKELFQQPPFIFFDEIQNIPGWEKFARRLADSNYQIYITGSNAAMLSKEMATTLGGRYLVKEIDTLSFTEFLTFNDFEINENIEYSERRFDLKRLFNEWFLYGGFPEILKYQDKKEYLNTIFLKVLLGDIIARHQVRNTFALQLVVKKLAESATDEVSFNRIRHIIQSTGIKVGTATVIEYISYLENSFLIKGIKNCRHNITDKETKKKYYFRDHGLLNLFLHDPSSLALETLVFNCLTRVYKEVYYVRDSLEVDFYIPGKQLIQVCYNLNDLNTREREVKSLVNVSRSFKTKEYSIITYDEEETIQAEDLKISVTPIWKWLLKLHGNA